MRRVFVCSLALAGLALGQGPAAAQNAKVQRRIQVQVKARAAAIALVPVQPVVQAEPALTDEQILQKAKLAADGPALLDYFRKRTLAETNREQMQALIRQLGDDEFQVREHASAALVKLGARAIPFLREAEKNTDVEILRRAERCRLLIEGEAGAAVSAAAARILARIKPAGATEVLLAYLPFVEDESVAEEIRTTLSVVGVRDSKPDPVLVKALEDRLPVKRGAAAEALCRAEVRPPVLTAVHKLLKDKDPTVRLQAALGLVPHNSKPAVETLIALLGEMDPDRSWQAQEVLYRLAGDKAPNVNLGGDQASRTACSQAWAEWWQKNKDAVDLAKAGRTPRLLGYTLLVQRDFVWKGGRFQTGTVKELDANKKERWKIENLNYPVDAQLLPNNRVLITEYQGRQVTERDLKGNIKWTKNNLNGMPLSAQRLANGNTFIAMQNQLLEVDKDGKEVFTMPRGHDIMKARKLRNGQIAVITNQGRYALIDPKTKREVKGFSCGWVQMWGSMDVLPNGHVLVPQFNNSKVAEYDGDGKIVWQADVQWPTSVKRLPNGQTLVASLNTNQVLVLDRKGKVVWQHVGDGQVFEASRR